MRNIVLGLSAFTLIASTAPASAQEADAAPEAVTLSGSVGLVSDYRFRGFSQTNKDAAIQGGITATHESGFYVGTWGSSVSFAGNAEVDFFGGWSGEVSPGVTVDAGLLYYLYPKHGDGATDFFEPYVNVSGSVGPATLKVGANYAWKQSALGDNSAIYVHAEPSIAIPNTPLGLNAHVGYAKSDGFPGGVDGKVWDYSVGATATWRNLTFGVSYVDTDEPSAIRGSDAGVVFSLTASF